MKRVRLGLLVAIALALSACAGATVNGHRRNGPPLTRRPVSSSRLILHGRVRCTATLTTPVQAGHALGISFRFHNVSRRKVDVQLGYGGMWVVVKSPDGTTYDTRVPLEDELGPYIPPIAIRPGGTETRTIPYLRARWSGPLSVTPGCGLTKLPPLRVAVTSPGRPANDRAAVAAVVAAAGHLLDHCRPRRSGVAVVGRIDAPRHSAPPLRAACSVSIEPKRGFDVGQVLVVTPPTLRARIRSPYESLSVPNGGDRNTEAIAWEFVVTHAGAASVYSSEVDTSRTGSGRMAPDWQWTSSSFGPQPGGSRCGGSGSGFGGVNGPLVEFVSICR